MKPIKCKLILHGAFKQFDGGNFDSIAEAKRYISRCWNRPYTIVKIKYLTNNILIYQSDVLSLYHK